MSATDDASARVMDALRRLVSALRTSGAAASGKLGMSVAQLFALRIVGARPGLSMGDLADRTLTTPSTVSEVVSRLVARGLVRRDQSPDDHRRMTLRMTRAGRSLLGGIEQTLPERLIAALATIPEDQRVALADAMDAWVAAAGLRGVPASMFGEHRVRARGAVHGLGSPLGGVRPPTRGLA